MSSSADPIASSEKLQYNPLKDMIDATNRCAAPYGPYNPYLERKIANIAKIAISPAKWLIPANPKISFQPEIHGCLGSPHGFTGFLPPFDAAFEKSYSGMVLLELIR
jgi:hypothetical protein